MTDRTTVHGLQVATELHRFIEQQVLLGTGIEPAAFAGTAPETTPTPSPTGEFW